MLRCFCMEFFYSYSDMKIKNIYICKNNNNKEKNSDDGQ